MDENWALWCPRLGPLLPPSPCYPNFFIRGQVQSWGPFSPTARSRTRKQTSHTRSSHTRSSHTRSIGKPSSSSCQAWHGAILLIRLLVALRHVLCQVERAVEPAEDQVRVRPARPLSAAWPPSARPRGRDRAAGRRTVVGGMCLMSSAACSSIACASQPVAALGRACDSSSPSRTALW